MSLKRIGFFVFFKPGGILACRGCNQAWCYGVDTHFGCQQNSEFSCESVQTQFAQMVRCMVWVKCSDSCIQYVHSYGFTILVVHSAYDDKWEMVWTLMDAVNEAIFRLL